MSDNLLSFPHWTTEITDTTVDGEDQLGVEGAAQGYQQFILPGITTVTEHARYYSFYAWILYRFIFDKDSSRLLADFRGAYFKRHEVALILAAYAHHLEGPPFSGVVGSGSSNYKSKQYWATSDPISLDHENYFKNKLGGFGQYYRIAMQAMGIVEEEENPRWVYRLTERGKALAEAYQTSIASTHYAINLESHRHLKHLSQADAMDYGQAGCICPAAIQTGHDRKLLLDAFFRFDEPQKDDNPHVRRRNSLGVALDLVYQARSKFMRDMLRPALYIGEYTAGIRYHPAEELTEWVRRWQMVEVRHMFTFGLQCLWAAFLLELDEKRAIKRSDWQAWLQTRLTALQWNIPLRQLAEKLCAEAGVDGNFESLQQIAAQAFGMDSRRDEFSLYLHATKNPKNALLLFQTGVSVLLQLYLRYSYLYQSKDPIWEELAVRERLPLNEFFKEMESGLLDHDWQAEKWLAWIYQEFIFFQHELMALEKLRYQEYDTFKFYFEEGTFHWPTGKKAYREPIRLAANRLDNCITMLVDLGLILENEDGTLSLSIEGNEYHDRILRELRHAD